MSFSATDCTAEDTRILCAINSPVMPSAPTLVTKWSSERKRVGEGVEKQIGRRGRNEGEGKQGEDLHI